MDIKQLKFLIALDETRHFGQAAARCHITQPTLSMRLRSLEEELDLPLVNRGQRFEGFTAPGERVLAWARTVLAAYDGLYAEAAACRGNLVGTLRLGVVPLSSFDPLPLLHQLHGEHPNLRFELSALSSEQILEQLANNRLDLACPTSSAWMASASTLWPSAKPAWACCMTSVSSVSARRP